MTRTFLATLTAACCLTAAAPAQTYLHSPYGYSSYYAPSYSTYGYTSGYGPLGVLSPRTWFGAPNYSAAYTSPFYGSTTSYTSAYAPLSSTAYYAPAVGSTVLASNSCCSPCCSPCGACATCPSGTCPSGNCALNYAPAGDLKPEPDPASSGSSGTKNFESQSDGAGAGSPADQDDDDSFGPYRGRPSDGFGEGTQRGAGYGPERPIERKAPAPMGDEAAGSAAADKPAEPEAAGAAEETPDALGAPAAEADGPDASLPALNLDTRITAAPSLVRERTVMRARFGSPRLARAKVDPADLVPAEDLRLVRK